MRKAHSQSGRASAAPLRGDSGRKRSAAFQGPGGSRRPPCAALCMRKDASRTPRNWRCLRKHSFYRPLFFTAAGQPRPWLQRRERKRPHSSGEIRKAGQIRQSTGRKDNDLDNAVMENFFGLRKSVLLCLQKFQAVGRFKRERIDCPDSCGSRIRTKRERTCRLLFAGNMSFPVACIIASEIFRTLKAASIFARRSGAFWRRCFHGAALRGYRLFARTGFLTAFCEPAEAEVFSGSGVSICSRSAFSQKSHSSPANSASALSETMRHRGRFSSGQIQAQPRLAVQTNAAAQFGVLLSFRKRPQHAPALARSHFHHTADAVHARHFFPPLAQAQARFRER